MAEAAQGVDNETTRFGFKYGAATVSRFTDFQDGTVLIGIEGDTGRKLDVYVSPTGRSIRVFENGKELKAVEE